MKVLFGMVLASLNKSTRVHDIMPVQPIQVLPAVQRISLPLFPALSSARVPWRVVQGAREG